MDQQRKTAQSLTADLDSRREELSSFYRRFGEKMIVDSDDSAAGGGAVPEDRVASWKALMSAREGDARAILDVKTAVVRQQELQNFRKELDSSVSDERAARRVQLERLGSLLYRDYDPARDSASLSLFYDEASSRAAALERHEDDRDRLKRELEDAGFFGKMLAQFRMASIASAMRQSRSRLNAAFADGARSLVDSGELARRGETGVSSAEEAEAYGRIAEIGSRLAEISARVDTLDADMTAVSESLASRGASANPQRRISELMGRIKDADRRIDALATLSAREYADKFLDEEGKSLLGDAGDGNTFSDMGAYAHQLEQIALMRSEIAVVKRRIELIETSLRIETIDRNVAGFRRSIADCERKIAHYRSLAERLGENVAAAAAERETLVARRDGLQRVLDAKDMTL
jgi:hypothetical protein